LNLCFLIAFPIIPLMIPFSALEYKIESPFSSVAGRFLQSP
jgi:hypothetical protein